MIYLTGGSGLTGTRFREHYYGHLKKISYRKFVPNKVFDSHEKSCLVHLGWASNPRIKDPEVLERDIENSKKLFEYYLDKNSDGKIIFTSSAGDMHTNHDDMFISGHEIPYPRTPYGEAKLKVENILKDLNCNSTVLRISNIWGGKVDSKRTNGLVDKLLSVLDTDEVVNIYANLQSHVDLIHVDDLVNLIIKVIHSDLKGHELFLIGGQSISISDIIDRVSTKGTLNLKVNQKDSKKSFINVKPFKAENIFDWTREHYL